MKIVVVTADAFHLGYLGAYGNDWIETPALDRLAVEGIVFDNHIADQPDAAGARRTWRTGWYHLPTEDLQDRSASAPPTDLLTLLRAGGVRTLLVRDERSPAIAAFLDGWDEVVVAEQTDDADALETTLEAAAATLDDLDTIDSWLLWIELGTLLPPWQVPNELVRRYLDLRSAVEGESKRPAPLTEVSAGSVDPADLETWQRLQDSYAGAVSYLDAGLEQLWSEIEERGLADEVCLLVTSAHGLPLGEHGMVGLYRPWLYDELIHTPLLLRLPGAAEATRRVLALTQPVDVLPTLLDLFGLPAVTRHGHSILPLARGRLTEVRPYAVSGLRLGERVEWALRTPEWSFLLPVRQEVDDPPRPRQLYVRPDDRWEVNNLVQHHLALADHLAEVLQHFEKRSRNPEPFEPPKISNVEQAEAPATP